MSLVATSFARLVAAWCESMDRTVPLPYLLVAFFIVWVEGYGTCSDISIPTAISWNNTTYISPMTNSNATWINVTYEYSQGKLDYQLFLFNSKSVFPHK